MHSRIVFIGGGNMAQAILGGLLQQGAPASSLFVIEPDADKRAVLSERYGITTLALDAALPDVDVVVLAVKPQQLREVTSARAAEMAGKLVVSIAAGVRTADLNRWLAGKARLMRVMPNTPALVRAGVSGVFAAEGTSAADVDVTETILGAIGRVVWVKAESDIDIVTAISGSGPAYVFHFIEGLARAGRELGLAPALADELAKATFEGAIRLALDSDDDVGTLRKNVTSKGGTTEAALNHMMSAGLEETIVQAAKAAHARAGELADILGRD
ncbi:pyrroline-5-carboxylate reductase [Burkholderiaceae bacterium DAT-1]|nr:pyrroline-5-carboxylate reductase [Burkholderiaceae bacterium DAT-1]